MQVLNIIKPTNLHIIFVFLIMNYGKASLEFCEVSAFSEMYPNLSQTIHERRENSGTISKSDNSYRFGVDNLIL